VYKRQEHTGEWILLEVNARPWGSLPLPVAVGADFPYLLYQTLVKDELVAQRAYRTNVYGRNLVPDLWQLRAQLQELSTNRVRQITHLTHWLLEFGRVLIGREHLDVMVLDDMRPGWAELTLFFKEHFGSRFGGATAHQNMDRPALATRVKSEQALGRPAHIVFVCQGNICRSPYAELKAQQCFAAQTDMVRFSSAGMLPRNSRPSPAAAIAAAARHGVDLTPHLSQCVDEKLLASATAIVIFDNINLNSLLDRHQNLLHKTYFIDEISGSQDYSEVLDPEGQGEDGFMGTYDLIDQCINAFHKHLSTSTTHIS